ncbi:ribosome assembly factor SBDS [Candidatus Geothermarchaeota archaeon]|nr:MAG: ribosome assembly factor SBDS [Candidatus Geothermarchaeota archaeon]
MVDYTIARFKKGSKKFEVLVDPDKALEYKLGRRKDFTGVLVFDEVYSDANKGLRASRSDLMEVFGTADIQKIAERIVKEGDLQIRAEQRRKLIEEKKKQIVSFISRYCVDARTNAPIPPIRIESILDEAGVRIDPFRSIEEQINDILEEMSKIIPIKRQMSILSIKVPAIYVGKAYGYLKNAGDLLNEEWLNDGSLQAMISIPSGLKVEFIEKLGRITNGTAYAEIIEEKTI